MTIYTGGTFDLFHRGHLELLRYCRLLAGPDGEVCVALNTDSFVESYKGKAPVMTYAEREEMLLTNKLVDEVVPNLGGADSKPTILAIDPDMIVIGSDWLEKDYCKQMQFDADWLSKNQIMLCYVPRTTGQSTTALKQRIRE